MNKSYFALAIAALVLSNVLAARSDFFRASAPPATQPIVMAQAAQAAPTPNLPPVAPPSQAPAITGQNPPLPEGQAAAPAPPLTAQEVYMQDQAAVARINAQIDALLQQQRGGFAVTYYAKPAPPGAPGQYGGLQGDPIQQRIQQLYEQRQLQALELQDPDYVRRDRSGDARKFVIARAGDTVYATLDRAFNSDDPQAPIFATIHDVDEAGIQGPLDGVRMIGNIKYSSSQGAIQFDKAYLPDGRTIEVKGIAINENTARTGVALNVDNHDIERYGSLLFATLVQGVGQVGQILTQNNQQAFVDPATGLLVGQQKFNPYQAAAGAILPAGQALTAVAAQQFNRPPTISAPAGFGLGIVFVEPVAVPRDVLFARNR